MSGRYSRAARASRVGPKAARKYEAAAERSDDDDDDDADGNGTAQTADDERAQKRRAIVFGLDGPSLKKKKDEDRRQLLRFRTFAEELARVDIGISGERS